MDNREALDIDPVEFDELADLFVELGVFSSPSELHGMLCGQLARGDGFEESSWLASAAIFLEQERFESDEAKTLLLELFALTRQQLNGPGFELLLLLPDDTADIESRAESLGRWCQGFVAGFGAARKSLTEEARETLDDMSEIAQIQQEGLEDEEDNEQDLMQIIEYVRMAAIMVYSERHTEQADASQAPSKPSLH